LSGAGGLYLNANRLRIELPGYRTLDLVGIPFRDSVITLDRDSALPPEMVRIAGGALDVFFPGFEHIKPIALHDYLMDRFEVTNGEIKRSADSGGYRRRELWDYPSRRGGRVNPWPATSTRESDPTGTTGPSTWESARAPTG